jgi:tRNA A37 N6-isopentenylltransferase MiaA
MTNTSDSITEFVDVYDMSKTFFYRLLKQGKGPVMTGNRIKLADALVFGEERARATSEAYRRRWEAGIRRVKIDRTLAQLSQDKADATARSQHKREKLAAYERELDAWERLRAKDPRSLKPRPAHPYATRREPRPRDHADWLPFQSIPSR